MRTPKSLTALASKVSARVEVLTYRNNGMFQTGFAVVDADDNELLTIEPVYYRSTGDRWYIVNKCMKTREYRKSLRALTAEIQPMHTGYKFSFK